jgi:N-acetylneuraminate synthase
VFTEKNIRSLRPNLGCAPRLLPEILGKRAAHDIARGTPMNLRMKK